MLVSSHFAPVTSDRIQKGEHWSLPSVHSSPGLLLGCHPAMLLDPCSAWCWQQLLIQIGQFHAGVHHQNIIFRQPSPQTSTVQNWTLLGWLIHTKEFTQFGRFYRIILGLRSRVHFRLVPTSRCQIPQLVALTLLSVNSGLLGLFPT